MNDHEIDQALTNLDREIAAAVDTAIAHGKPYAVSWITHRIVSEQATIAGPDAEWYRLCAYEYVRKAVRECLRRHPHLRAYVLDRDGDKVVALAAQLTAEELRALAASHERHAQELARYRDGR